MAVVPWLPTVSGSLSVTGALGSRRRGPTGAHIPSGIQEIFATAWIDTQRQLLGPFQALSVVHVCQGAEGGHSLV